MHYDLMAIFPQGLSLELMPKGTSEDSFCNVVAESEEEILWLAPKCCFFCFFSAVRNSSFQNESAHKRQLKPPIPGAEFFLET